MKHLKILLLILASILLFAACGGGGGSGSGSEASIEGSWEVIEADVNGIKIDAPGGMGIVMVFSGGEYTYTTSNDCVEQGTYVVDDTTITSTTTADTCDPEEVGEVSAVNYSVTATTFTITDGADYLLFEKR